MRILVFGWYGHGNVGDESFKDGFLKVWKNRDFTFIDRVTDDVLSTQAQYDLCIIGGGDIINEKNINQLKQITCKKIAMSVTITANSLFKDIEILDYIYVRDLMSLKVLQDYGFKNCEYIPDIALCLKGDKDKGKVLIEELFKKSGSNQRKKVYTIVINAHLQGNSQTSHKNKNMFNKYVDDTVEVLDSTDASFLFLPYSTSLPWDDRVTNAWVNSHCKLYKKNCVIYDKLSVKDTLDIIAASDMIITSRFHGLIYGITHNIPTVTISFHDKTAGFANTIGQKFLDYWMFCTTSFREHIKTAKMSHKINTDEIVQEYNQKVDFLK